ncbi:hypothetical protein Goklo_024857, partial [Gossypium klotzschianum]|nr:hypothetical protein [Gossypium klotzschianum]
LWLPVDESVVTESIQSANWGAVCGDILGANSEMIYGGRIEMAWIRKNFVGIVEDSTKLEVRRVGDIIPRDVSGNATRKNQNWWLPFTTTIMGLVLVSIFTSSSELPVYIPTRNKVSLVVYATVKMHKTDKVLLQFEFGQSIIVAPQDLDDLRPINLRRLNKNWPTFHSQHINMWNNQYDFLPTCGPIIIPKLTCNSEYMP